MSDIEEIGESMWRAGGTDDGPLLAISFGVHGDERPPIDAGERLLAMLQSGELSLLGGQLLLIHGNPRASEQDRRFSEGGVDLNRCFHNSTLTKPPERYEEARAIAIDAVLRSCEPQALVDFHCTVEPGDPFLMQHPAADDTASREVTRLLSGEVVLADPKMNFGGVSLDEWMSTRGHVGICYETGWIRSPMCTPEFVLGEMLNVIAGLGLVGGARPLLHDDKVFLQLDHVVRCEAEGFRWSDGIGENLQALPAGTVIGAYAEGVEVTLPADATLVFPKKQPHMVELGKPLVYLGVVPS